MDYQAARHNMIENQVRPNKVTDLNVIKAMDNIPREKFVPAHAGSFAYSDKAILLSKDRYLMAPALFARLLQEAQISTDDMVLNIGCGSGYPVAVLARIAKAVVGIEVDPVLAKTASALLVELGIDNALILEKVLVGGYAKQAPYDVIIFNGAIHYTPKKIIDQLAEGGRLVSVVADVNQSYGSMGKVVIMYKFGGQVSESEIFDAATPLLSDFENEKYFKF
ncbi:MAG: protein-L-isoaspartate O-methyltransferase [Pseudomonadota bacterium]|nr:protein-L-isoaspartate O-methyltransferase [Pseudomonadota bacterium]